MTYLRLWGEQAYEPLKEVYGRDLETGIEGGQLIQAARTTLGTDVHRPIEGRDSDGGRGIGEGQVVAQGSINVALQGREAVDHIVFPTPSPLTGVRIHPPPTQGLSFFRLGLAHSRCSQGGGVLTLASTSGQTVIPDAWSPERDTNRVGGSQTHSPPL